MLATIVPGPESSSDVSGTVVVVVVVVVIITAVKILSRQKSVISPLGPPLPQVLA